MQYQTVTKYIPYENDIRDVGSTADLVLVFLILLVLLVLLVLLLHLVLLVLLVLQCSLKVLESPSSL